MVGLEEDDTEGMGLEVELATVASSDCLGMLCLSACPIIEKRQRAELQAGVHACRAQEYKQRHHQDLHAKHAIASLYKHCVHTSHTIKATLFTEPLHLDCDAHDLPHTMDGAWLGHHGLSAEVTPEIKKLIDEGYRLIKWDGRKNPMLHSGRAQLRFCAISALSHASWQTRDDGVLKPDDMIHRQGEFLAFPTGVSFGGGSKVPGNLQTPAGQAPIVETLKQDENVQRIAGFQLSTCISVDCHFPPGSTVLIPSGAVEHGNMPVGPTETCMSFTQYAAGGLFCWVVYGFKSVCNTLGGKCPKRGRAAKAIQLTYDLEEGVRWAKGVKLFSTPDSIVGDCLRVFSKSL
ncbi:hypothetical protein DXG01_003333 [Tephrocybe rancida]|nr:hypothetical protein DXG01_003333 [Tephrocybe rancida]